jgi:predicted alpha/beta-hydrolase family hydrolase
MVPVTLEEKPVKLASGPETTMIYGIPEQSNCGCVVIAHGAGGPMHSPFIRYFHTELAMQGFLTVKFNFPYMEARRKMPDRTNILEETYRTVLEQVSQDYHPSKLFIGGKSMGGRIASHIAASGTDCTGLYFLGYPLHPPGKTDRLRDQHLYKITKPMLFVSGTRDSFATHDLLTRVVDTIGPSARIHWIESGDHGFKTPNLSGKVSWEEPFRVLLEWLRQLANRN